MWKDFSLIFFKKIDSLEEFLTSKKQVHYLTNGASRIISLSSQATQLAIAPRTLPQACYILIFPINENVVFIPSIRSFHNRDMNCEKPTVQFLQ